MKIIEIKIKTKFYYQCHYQAKISKEKKQILEIQIHKTTINK
jgi:hypothetical protein